MERLQNKLEREIVELRNSVKASSNSIRKYSNELKAQCHWKCVEIWTNYEDIVEEARQNASDLTHEMERRTEQQVRRWRRLLDKNEKNLKEIEKWRLKFVHLLRENHDERNVLQELNQLSSQLSSGHNKWMQPREQCELAFTLPDWWNKAMVALQTKQTGFTVSCVQQRFPAEKLVKENQWNLLELQSRQRRTITAIHISEKDNHIFLCCFENQSLLEINEKGKFLSEFSLSDGKNIILGPSDICSISPDLLVVCGWGENKLWFLERISVSPFMKVNKIIKTETNLSTLCVKNETIFVCDVDLGIHSFTKEGVKMKTFAIEGPHVLYYVSLCFEPRIRVDPSSGDIWWARLDYPEIMSFNSNGQKIDSLQKEETFSAFCFNEFGQIYFCDEDGIFAFPKKQLYKFEKQLEEVPRIFVFQNKCFIAAKKNGRWIIEIFKIFY